MQRSRTHSKSQMPRSRGPELLQRPSQPHRPKTMVANGAHHRPVGDRTSPRSPLHEKKRAGSRVAELEAKLGKAQDEITKLRDQLTSAEAAKKGSQAALKKAKKRVAAKGSPVRAAAEDEMMPEEQKRQEAVVADIVTDDKDEESGTGTISPAANVFEVVAPSETSQGKENQLMALVGAEASCGDKRNDEKEVMGVTKKMNEEEVDNNAISDVDGEKESLEGGEVTAKETETAVLRADKAELDNMVEEDEAATKASKIAQELKESVAREAQLGERLRASERAREALEADMRRLRVQSEQWRKAAEEAAVALRGKADVVEPRVAMDSQHGSAGKGNGGDDEGFGGKRKDGAGMWMLRGLWKKKRQK